MTMTLSRVVCMLVLGATVCYAHDFYRDHIPNGYNCPNPCTLDRGDVWTRVGHNLETPCMNKDQDRPNKFGDVSISLLLYELRNNCIYKYLHWCCSCYFFK